MLVSIYMPTRNRRDTAERAIRSVQAQTHEEIELIVVDDASDDGTASMVQDLALSDGRIIYLRQDSPGGAPVARNRAIAHSRGAFVTGLDDDDYFHANRIAAFVQSWDLLAQTGLTVCGLYSQEYAFSGDVMLGESRKPGHTRFSDMAGGNYIGNQIFAPRAHYTEIGMFKADMPAWQDMELFMRMTKAFGPARLVDAPLYYIDLSPRQDRISLRRDKLRQAYEIVSREHFGDDPRAQQRLMLQLFSAHYRIRPSASDLLDFARKGMWPSGMIKMMRRMLAAG